MRLLRTTLTSSLLFALALVPSLGAAQTRAELYANLFDNQGIMMADVSIPLKKLFPRVSDELRASSFAAVQQAVQSNDPGPQPQGQATEEFGDWVRMTTTPLFVSGQGFKTAVLAHISPFRTSSDSPRDEAEKAIAKQALRDLDSNLAEVQLNAYSALTGKKSATKVLAARDYAAARRVLSAIANRRTSQIVSLRTAQEDSAVKLPTKSRLTIATNVPTDNEGLYFIGAGFAINPYVQTTVGFSFLDANDKKGKLTFGLSFDLSLVQALFGGGKKKAEENKPEDGGE